MCMCVCVCVCACAIERECRRELLLQYFYPGVRIHKWVKSIVCLSVCQSVINFLGSYSQSGHCGIHLSAQKKIKSKLTAFQCLIGGKKLPVVCYCLHLTRMSDSY